MALRLSVFDQLDLMLWDVLVLFGAKLAEALLFDVFSLHLFSFENLKYHIPYVTYGVEWYAIKKSWAL